MQNIAGFRNVSRKMGDMQCCLHCLPCRVVCTGLEHSVILVWDCVKVL